MFEKVVQYKHNLHDSMPDNEKLFSFNPSLLYTFLLQVEREQ